MQQPGSSLGHSICIRQAFYRAKRQGRLGNMPSVSGAAEKSECRKTEDE